jgi:pyruvate/2-oxoglutarate dehydrogenase complex dihydrolipoamide acyltransferase (E2) component
MATSADTLSRILDELVKHAPTDRASAIRLLSAKGLLPKKLTELPKEKKVSRFASKAAEEYAEAKSVDIPEGFKGSGNNDKITVKDIKILAEGPKKQKANASPSALQFARDNGLDLTRIAHGSGAEGKILLKDVKDLKGPEPVDVSEDDDKPPKISPPAAKLMKQWDIDEDDLEDIEGTGKDGTILAKDLKELVELIKLEKDGEDSD